MELDEMLTLLITVPIAVVGLILLKFISSIIKHGFRGLLIHSKLINPNEKRSYTQLVGFTVGKTVGNMVYNRKLPSMKPITNFVKFLLCITLCLLIMFTFSILGVLGLVLGHDLIGKWWVIAIEIVIGAPLIVLIVMPVLEAAKRINFLNPYNKKGRLVMIASVISLCVYLLSNSLLFIPEFPVYIKASYLIYTLTIYIAFCAYTFKWDRDKVSREWFEFGKD